MHLHKQDFKKCEERLLTAASNGRKTSVWMARLDTRRRVRGKEKEIWISFDGTPLGSILLKRKLIIGNRIASAVNVEEKMKWLISY